MGDNFILMLDNIEELNSLDDLPKHQQEAARIALNQAATSGRTRAAQHIRREVNFPASYLSPREGRLAVTDKARNDHLEVAIGARVRPTSLARFTLDNRAGGGAKRESGVRVSVKPGSVQRLPGAFLIRLRAGTADLDTKSNLGLAVRTKNGKPPPGYKPTKFGDNLWLLYGPSVSQAFINARNTGVASDISPQFLDDVEFEFYRQMDRLT